MFAQTVSAQQDSLSRVYFDPLQLQYNETLTKDLDLLPFITYTGLGKAEINFGHFSGGLKPVQEADQKNNFQFNSYGARKLKKFTVAGGFTYSRKLADSVRWNHRTELNEDSPYYFGSQAATNYDHVSYHLSALATYQVSDKVNFGLGSDYHVGSSFSSNDPRGKLEPFKLMLRTNLGIKFGDDRYINASARWGYGYNDMVIDYKNKVYYESLVFPAYITYFNYGLGYVTTQGKPDRRKLIQHYDYRGVGLGYSKVTDQLLFHLKVNYDVKKEQARFGSKTSLDENASIGDFNVRSYQVNSLLCVRNDLMITLTGTRRDGKDKNALFSGVNNFVKESNQFSLQAIKNFGKAYQEHTLILDADYAAEYRADGSAATSLNSAYILGGLRYQKAFKKNSHQWSIGLSTSYKKPLYSEISYSVNNLNTFINDVVFNDYYFNELDILKTELMFNSILNIENFMPVSVSANISRSTSFKTNSFSAFGSPLQNWEFGCSLAIIVK